MGTMGTMGGACHFELDGEGGGEFRRSLVARAYRICASRSGSSTSSFHLRPLCFDVECKEISKSEGLKTRDSVDGSNRNYVRQAPV